jgi:hypothetical protein
MTRPAGATIEAADPLADVFLCSYGAFPSAEETGVDYVALTQTSLLGVGNFIQNGAKVPIPPIERETIATLNRVNMERHYAVQNHWDWPGFYVGEANNFGDLTNFWNLCAADIPLEFFDPLYADRLGAKAAHWAAAVRQAPPPPHGPEGLAIWHREERPIDDACQHFGDSELRLCDVDESIWNGGNVRAPIMYFGNATALASIDEGGTTATMTFALTDKPFAADRDARRQHYVLSVDPGIGLFRNEQATLRTPFIPELNEFYGRNAHAKWNVARSEPDSLGIVTSVRQSRDASRSQCERTHHQDLRGGGH